MPYSLRIALQSLWHEKWINFLSMLTIAMGLLVITLMVSTIYNINLFARKLPERFFIVAYLGDRVNEQQAQDIIASLKERNGIEKVKYISKAEALKELRTSLKDAEYVLEGLNENPLPASIEIRFKKEAMGPESVKTFVNSMKKIEGIEDVQYGEKFLLSIHSLKTAMETIGLILTLVTTSGIIFICYSTVKILFYRRKEEIETLKLLGATRAFIRTPFVIEGAVIGVVGGVLSMIVVITFYLSVFRQLSATLPIVRTVVFPAELFLPLPLIGLFLGITGSFIAMGRIKF
ncbi:MAG TPA: permease-like cell division protein FtsX [Thermodesulfovibrionales bacterium]|nr:permease-like cell division protein FtsX [Thermodesulfovibrionales bacterium]